jgi:23S rRNA pseudouridine1911/1915/1917 synthase
VRRLVVPERLAGERLDRAIATLCLDVSRSEARRLIDLGRVTVDGRMRRPSMLLAAGSEILLERLPAPPEANVVPETIPLTVVYEDEHVVVIDKPAGLVVHPGAGRRSGTLVAGLLARYGGLPGKGDRPGVVHRLDRNTSGLIAVARTPVAFRELARAIAERRVVREYLGLVWGVPEPRAGDVDTRIARSRRDRRRMSPSRVRGRPALTTYEVLEPLGVASLVRLRLGTGRTHQIRVHMRHLGHPVVGDPDYGGRQAGLLSLPVPARRHGKALLAAIDRQALHASRLRFPHPVGGEPVELASPLPADIDACLRLLRDHVGRA